MASAEDTPTTGRSVTAKVLALLASFTPVAQELTLSELARRARVSLPTAHRRVAELVEWGALERASDGRYRIGLRLWELASLAPRGLGLREAAMPLLEDLYEITRENVQLAVREGTEVVFVERITGRDAVPVYTRVGGRFALHATGVGLVLLAHAPLDIQQDVLENSLERYSPKTITEPAALRAKLADIRRSGFAVSDGQVTTDALSVAAPITDPEGTVTAAVSLVVRAADARPSALAPAVRSAARSISRALNTPGPLPTGPGPLSSSSSAGFRGC